MKEDLSFLFDYINKYDEKNHNFLNTVIHQLIIIYGETNIVNPAQTRNIEVLKSNLGIYDYPKEQIDDFCTKLYNIFTKYIKNEYYEKDIIFIEVQKKIIDMMIYKKNKIEVSEEEMEMFESTLYSKYNPKLIFRVFNVLFNRNRESIYNYWLTKKDIDFSNIDVEFLPAFKYEQFGLSLEEVKKMPANKINSLNEQIRIMDKDENETSGGRDQSIIEDKPKKLVLTSGNALVDAILLMGFIATQLFVGLLIFLKLG